MLTYASRWPIVVLIVYSIGLIMMITEDSAGAFVVLTVDSARPVMARTIYSAGPVELLLFCVSSHCLVHSLMCSAVVFTYITRPPYCVATLNDPLHIRNYIE